MRISAPCAHSHTQEQLGRTYRKGELLGDHGPPPLAHAREAGALGGGAGNLDGHLLIGAFFCAGNGVGTTLACCHACRSWHCCVRCSLTSPRVEEAAGRAEGGWCGCACRGAWCCKGGWGPTWDLVDRAWAVGVGDVERVRSIIHLQVNRRQRVCVVWHDWH